MKQFEDDMYSKWAKKMEEALPNLLKRSILSKPPPTPAPASTAQTPMPGDSRSTSRAADYSHILPPRELSPYHINPGMSPIRYPQKLFQLRIAPSIALKVMSLASLDSLIRKCLSSCFLPAVPANCEFVVNFSPELSEIIRESCCMEKLGYHVPDLARNVALQEEKFVDYCSGLEHCLSRYHSLLASLTEAEVLTIHCL